MRRASLTIVAVALAAASAVVTGIISDESVNRAAALAVNSLPEDANSERTVLSAAERSETLRSPTWGGEVRSLLARAEPLQHGEYLWDDRGVPPGPVRVRVDLRTQLVSVFRAGHEIGSAVILYGAKGHETPTGTFPIRARISDYRSRTYDAPMPYSLMLTDDGIAIHGSEVSWGTASHGCIGVPLEFARRLFGAAHEGDRVLILRTAQDRTA